MNGTRRLQREGLPARRVRYEPPSIEEAVQAACDLTSDIEQQVEIASGLIGMSPEEVREHVLRRPPARGRLSDMRGTFVVERRAPRLSGNPRLPVLRPKD
jgi:hypothetical protein